MQQKSTLSRIVSKFFPFTQKDEKKKNNAQKSVYCQVSSTSTAKAVTPLTPDKQKTKSTYGQPTTKSTIDKPAAKSTYSQPAMPRPRLARQPEKNLMLKRLAIEMCRYGLKQKESFVSTPFGVAWLLAILYESTDDQSKTEILALLDPKGQVKKENILKLVPAMLDRLKAEKAYRNDFEVTLDSSLQSRVKIRSDFEKTIGNKYWMTVSPIPSELSLFSATVKGDFKDLWEKPFDPKDTIAGDFFGLHATRKEDFMHYGDDLPYFEDDTMQAARLDAKSTTMWIVLPKEKVKFEDFVKTLDEATLDKLFDPRITQLLHVKLPKFNTSLPISTAGFLHSRGVKTIFEPGNRLPGMFDVDLWVQEIREEIEVKIDEAGCEAKFEITAAAYDCIELPIPTPIQFHANRPFLYYLCIDKEPLFAGVYM